MTANKVTFASLETCVVVNMCCRGHVLDFGRVAVPGTGRELLSEDVSEGGAGRTAACVNPPQAWP